MSGMFLSLLLGGVGCAGWSAAQGWIGDRLRLDAVTRVGAALGAGIAIGAMAGGVLRHAVGAVLR